ncbi:MAG: serine/threonine protein kinase, partial [Cyanobacteria bacterium M_surface_10_m1_298]|nr:serine/threonine protein kinase [Cyanobacteria bacterium M_surface_10_m1_298]
MERELITADLDAPELIGGRYRLERDLSAESRGSLWRASDQAADAAAVALRQINDDPEPWLLRWSRLQGVLHPQVPRCAEAIRVDGALWLPRAWVEGEPYAELDLAAVVQLLKQLLPVLSLLHDQGLSAGALSSEQLLRRSSDGLPVLLDLGGEPLESPQQDLSRLAALALALVAPADAEALQALEPYQRLQSPDPGLQFASASAALQALQQLDLSPPRPVQRRRKQRQEQDVEGRIGPVVVALVVAALLSTGLGW